MNVVEINQLLYTLTDLEKDSWVRLLNGSLKGKDPLHNATVANNSKDGISIRTVVLRKVNIVQKQIAFHTDVRSGKWQELADGDKISWLFYDAAARIQLRLSGHITKHSDDAIANEAWQSSTTNSKKVYTGTQAPSSITPIPISGLDEKIESSKIASEDVEIGKPNFGLIITKVKWMEWLFLSSKGHRRANFSYNDDDSFVAQWLIP